LILYFDEQLSLPEVAAILDIPLGTAKSRLAYGLSDSEALRLELEAIASWLSGCMVSVWHDSFRPRFASIKKTCGLSSALGRRDTPLRSLFGRVCVS
jgi:hypothetical protein